MSSPTTPTNSNSHNGYSHALTKYKPGSLREVWTISYPMMLASMSGALMLFLDQIILARYSLTAMNTVSSAWMIAASIQVFGIGIASIAEVFVGQHNGAKRFNRLGEPVWQMLYFSIACTIFIIPFAQLAGDYVLPDIYLTEGKPYFVWVLSFTPFWMAAVALSAFFVGQGKTKLVFVSTIISNLINVALVFAFVFGIKGWIPSMGIKGAALATGLAQVSHATLLFLVFFSRHNRENFGTANMALRPKVMWSCLKIGFPSSLGHSVEIIAWSAIIYLLATAGDDYVTVYNIGRSFFMPFSFMVEGLQKGIIAVASNYIGGEHWGCIKKTVLSTMRLVVIISSCLIIPLFLFPDLFLKYFFPHILSAPNAADLAYWIHLSLIGVFAFFIFDGATWAFAGVLTSGGDTKYIMIINVANAWLCAFVPVYLFIVKWHFPAYFTWFLTGFYAFANATLFYLRYKTGRWKVKHVH